MKKRKLIRNVFLVALSAVMVCGAAVGFTGCGSKSKPNELRVKIFCDATDAETNKAICEKWAKEYTEILHQRGQMAEDTEIKVYFDYNPLSDAYFTELDNQFSNSPKEVEDIIYMSPKYTRVWERKGRVLDISKYLKTEDQEEYARNIANINRVWTNALSFYGYSDEGYKAGTYNLGDALTYKTTADGVSEDGFYNVNGVKTGLYAMPKDYSNFSMGFNAKYFTDALKTQYQTAKATDIRNVAGSKAQNSRTADITYTGEHPSNRVVATYASGDGSQTNPANGEPIKAGQPAPLINIGIPTRYKPFNFYAYKDYSDAINGGDPVAWMVREYSEDIDGDGEGDGYVVTIPGFPGETFQITDDSVKDPNALYDTNIGHVVYTYAEFGALSWAITYYCNTFNWTAVDNGGDPLQGDGGMTLLNGNPENVFANDQYEGLPNSTLYLLPWLASNDADFINSKSDAVVQPNVTTNIADMNANTKGGTDSEVVKKLNLDGTYRDANVQYGLNSENFIETYGAFLAYGSDWNGNSGNSGVDKDGGMKADNGWQLFRDGACIFYGAGTWDSKTKNESSFDKCEYRQMPMPVAEKYALYSQVKDGYYNLKTYQWNSTTHTTVASPALPTSGLYTSEQVRANLTDRQDKWAARMDSVGYAINAYIEKLAQEEGGEWKLEGAVSLVMALTANAEDQMNLVYGGAQLPNFKHQCVELLQYQNPNYTGNGLEAGASTNLSTSGTFKDMLTPEGWSTTEYYVRDANGNIEFNADGSLKKNEAGVAEAKAAWAKYTACATAMSDAVMKNTADASKTVQQFIDSYNAANGTDIKCDPQYASAVLKDMPGEQSKIAAAMKYLRMTTYTYADRDLNVRMQYGLNSVRDSAMYTYTNAWIDVISMRTGGIAYAYNAQKSLSKDGDNFVTIASTLTTNPGATLQNGELKKFYTPAVYCLRTAQQVAKGLEDSKEAENRALRGT